jgi:hypothetical protein
MKTQIQDGNDYSQTVIIMETLKRIADDRDIAIIVIHHSKKIGKNKPENVLETSLGSTGIVAGADHLLYLERTPSSPSDAVLHYVSKDAEPAELALHFDHTIMGWSYQGEASDIADTNERQEILDLLQKDHALRTGEIAEKLGKKTPAVSNLIKKMVGKGLVTKLSYGLYCVNKGLEPYKTTKGSECLQSSESSETSPIVGNEDSLFHDFHGGEPLKDSETQEELEIF